MPINTTDWWGKSWVGSFAPSRWTAEPFLHTDSSEQSHSLSPSISLACVLLFRHEDSSVPPPNSPDSSSEGAYLKLALITHLNTVIVFLHCLTQWMEFFFVRREKPFQACRAFISLQYFSFMSGGTWILLSSWNAADGLCVLHLLKMFFSSFLFHWQYILFFYRFLFFFIF